MSSEGSVTHWFRQLATGDSAAAQKLWGRYFCQLVSLARKRLQGRAGRLADEEDVALSAFDTFCRGAEQGRFPQLLDRDNLWRVLVIITARKATALVRLEARQKRGGTQLARAPDPGAPAHLALEPDLDEIVGREPTPEFAAQVAEEFQRLLDQLGRPELKTIALWKMEGYSNDDIAGKLGCVSRTIERKLQRIRGLWREEKAR